MSKFSVLKRNLTEKEMEEVHNSEILIKVGPMLVPTARHDALYQKTDSKKPQVEPKKTALEKPTQISSKIVILQ